MEEFDEMRDCVQSARGLLEQLTDGEWRSDHAAEIFGLASQLEQEVTLLENEMALMGVRNES